MQTEMTAYLNGDFLALEECCISPLDRGFLFGDGVYEVMPVYAGRIFRCDAHLVRLARSLDQAGIANPHGDEQWRSIFAQLVERCGLPDVALYLQVTRGVAPRSHVVSAHLEPTVFAMTMPLHRMGPEVEERGVSVVTTEDLRWQRCDIKSISLMGNILLSQQAQARDAHEAILVRDGEVTEGASSNVFVVAGGVLATPSQGRQLLSGITRDVVIEIAQGEGIACEQRPLGEAELPAADEVWLTSSTREIAPVIRVNDRMVGDGLPGPMWRKFMSRLAVWK